MRWTMTGRLARSAVGSRDRTVYGGHMANDLEPLLLSIPETGRLLGIGRTYAYELVASGKIASVRIGKRHLVTRAEVQRFVDSLAAPISRATARAMDSAAE